MFSIDQSVLVVIDVQGKLAYLVHEHERTFKNIHHLIQASYLLDIPIIVSEQVPEKIGQTIPEIARHLKEHHHIIKKTFSCCGEPRFLDTLSHLKRKQIIICGIEAHVCVFQTVSDLLEKKYNVQVVANAVSSRTPENMTIAFERMRSLGAVLSSHEMLVIELLRTSEHPKFKEILKLIK